LIGTKRIVGCLAAMAMASASAVSFLPPLRNGTTNSAAISSAVWPVRGKPAAPVMGRATRLHRHLARRQLFCPSLERTASENATFNDRTVHIQHARRDDILCEINADRSKLFHDFPSCSD
jgi:hypothetical protein